MSFKCWLPIYEGEDEALVIEDESSADDAAAEACEKWNTQGVWSGDPIPDPIEVRVRDAQGKLWLVEVTPDWDVSFYCGKPVEQVLSDVEDMQHFMATDPTWGPSLVRYSVLVGMKYEAMNNNERHERYLLKEKLERAGLDPGWRPG